MIYRHTEPSYYIEILYIDQMVFGVKSLLCGATTKNTMNGESNIVFIVYCLRRG